MESKNTGKLSVHPSIMEEANRIYVMSKNGKLEEAMKHIETACDRNKNSALLHRLQAELFLDAALADKNPYLEKEFYHKAMISAQKAVSLSQNSLGFSFVYLYLLLREHCFQEIVQEGKRVLAVENPVDPATEDYTYPEYDFQTPEGRISLLGMSIREFVNQCENPGGKTRKQISDSVHQVYQNVSGERVLVKDIPNYPHRQLNEEEKMQRLWNSLSFDQKQDLQKVEIDDLLVHLNSTKYISAKKILSEAITFYRQNAGWKFWRCCCCNQKFPDSESHLKHVKNLHMEHILTEQTPTRPEQLEETWEQIIMNSKWKPICASAVIMALEEKWEECRLDEDWSRRKQWARKYLLDQNWPSSNDYECRSALHNIQTKLKFLVRNTFISAVHMNMLCEYSRERLEGVLPSTGFWKQCLAQTHLCICSLGISDLQNITNFLDNILKAPLKIASAKNPTFRKHQPTIRALPPDTTAESIALNENILSLLPDAQIISHADASLPSDDAVLQWIITDPLREEQLEKWKHVEEERGEEGRDVLMFQNGNILLLKDLFCKQNDLSNAKKAFKAAWDEFLGRKEEHDHQSFETILRKQRKDILEHQTAELERSDRLKLGCISTVLRETQSTDYQEIFLAPIQPQVCDFSTFKNLDEADTRVKEAMQNVDKSASLKIMKTDMKVRRTLGERKWLDKFIDSLAARDYSTILTPLVKSYILAKLQRQANKDIAEKSTAVRIANQAFASVSKCKSLREPIKKATAGAAESEKLKTITFFHFVNNSITYYCMMLSNSSFNIADFKGLP